MRRDRIDQLSFDHSLVWELVRRNHLTSEQANLSVPKNVITRSLGPEVEIEVDVEGPLAVELGDVYLLCSDGLSGPVDDREIGAFAANFHPRDACRYLVNLANLRGGLDNITVLIVRIGQWVDPDSAETFESAGRPRRTNAAMAAVDGWRSRLNELVKRKRRNAEFALVEDHPYRTYECPIDDAMIDRLDELTRNIQEQAVAQAWSLDWAALASLRRQAADARAAKNRWVSLRKIAEIISLARPGRPFLSQDRGAGSVDLSLTGCSRSFIMPAGRNEPDMSSTDSVPRDSTACARGPVRAESTSPPLVAPLELSVVYCPADLDHVDALYNGEASGFIYARDGHPNAAELADKLARLEGARGGFDLRLGHGCDRRGVSVAA